MAPAPNTTTWSKTPSLIPQMQKELLIPGCAGDGGGDHPLTGEAERLGARRDSGDRRVVDGRIHDQTARADLFASGLELWFHEHDDVCGPIQKWRQRRQDQPHRDEGDV